MVTTKPKKKKSKTRVKSTKAPKIQTRLDAFAAEQQAVKDMGPLKRGTMWLLPGSKPQYIIHILGIPLSMVTGKRLAIVESSVGEFMTMPVKELKLSFVRQKFIPLVDAAKAKHLH